MRVYAPAMAKIYHFGPRDLDAMTLIQWIDYADDLDATLEEVDYGA